MNLAACSLRDITTLLQEIGTPFANTMTHNYYSIKYYFCFANEIGWRYHITPIELVDQVDHQYMVKHRLVYYHIHPNFIQLIE